MSWLRKTAELISIVVNNPGATKSGTCALCESLDGEPVSAVGEPPYHNHCACGTQDVQMETQPENLLEEDFSMEPPEDVEEEREPGLVIPL